MTRLMRLALRLYPRSWRQRYGAELEALIEDSQPGWRGAIDIARGGVAMRLRSAPAILLLGTLAGAATGSALYVWSPLVHTTTSIVEVTGPDLRMAYPELLAYPHIRGALAIRVDGSALAITTSAAEGRLARTNNERVLKEIIDTSNQYTDGNQPVSYRVTSRRDTFRKSRRVTTIVVCSTLGLLLAGSTLAARRAGPGPFSLLSR